MPSLATTDSHQAPFHLSPASATRKQAPDFDSWWRVYFQRKNESSAWTSSVRRAQCLHWLVRIVLVFNVSDVVRARGWKMGLTHESIPRPSPGQSTQLPMATGRLLQAMGKYTFHHVPRDRASGRQCGMREGRGFCSDLDLVGNNSRTLDKQSFVLEVPDRYARLQRCP